MEFFAKKKKSRPKSVTFVRCPACESELVASGDFVSCNSKLVLYTCDYCGLKTEWDLSSLEPLLHRACKKGMELNIKGK